MPSSLVDLRSDTVTLPSAPMRQAMYEAEVGDDARVGPDRLRGDPTVRDLETLCAEQLGKAAALFVPSGTMANLVALRTWCPRNSPVAVGVTAHVYQRERSPFDPEYLGLRAVELDDSAGLPDETTVRESVAAHPALLCLENTHNAAGGRAWPPEQVHSAVRVARQAGMRVHLDGARLFNAAVALGRAPAALAGVSDSVGFSLSKGLGAPVGSVLLGPSDFITEARRVCKQLGGQMRQAGIVAAAGLIALRDGPDQLAEDHRNAHLLAELLAVGHPMGLEVAFPQTNIVYVRLSRPIDPLRMVTILAEKGLLVQVEGPTTIRLVLHRDVSAQSVPWVAETLLGVLREHCRFPFSCLLRKVNDGR